MVVGGGWWWLVVGGGEVLFVWGGGGSFRHDFSLTDVQTQLPMVCKFNLSSFYEKKNCVLYALIFWFVSDQSCHYDNQKCPPSELLNIFNFISHKLLSRSDRRPVQSDIRFISA